MQTNLALNIVPFKHPNSRPGNHLHTQQRVSPIRNTDTVNQIIAALKVSGRHGLRNATIFILQLTIGRRTNDMLRLKLSDVYDFNTNTVKPYITVDEHKTGKTARDLPLNPNICNLLTEYISTLKQITPDAYLFPSQKRNPDGSQRHLNTSSLDNILKEATQSIFKTIDTPQTHITSYAARKTYGYNLYTYCMKNNNGLLPDSNIPALSFLQSLFNHSSELVTLRYIGVYDTLASKLCQEIGNQYEY